MQLDLDKFASPGKIQERQQGDYDAWIRWLEGGKKKKDMRPLLGRFKGMIGQQSGKWTGNVELPPAVIKAEFTKQVVNAFNTYDPNKGTALGSWVGTNLQKGLRFISTHQNVARIGEHRIYKIGQFNAAKFTLDDQLGRPPTSAEVSDYLGWSEKEVERLDTEQRRSYIESAYEFDPTAIKPSRESEALNLVKYQLSPEERLVYDYTLGSGGKPQLKPGEISKKLNMSPSKVTRVRDGIYKKVKEYI